MSKKRRITRSSGSHLTQFLGGGSEFIPSEVPTLRDCLRNVIHLQSSVPVRSKISIPSIISSVGDNILLLWRQSNSDFIPPVVANKKTIVDRLMRAYDFFNWHVSSGRIVGSGRYRHARRGKQVADGWINALDRLFDITKCQYPITETSVSKKTL